MRREGDHPLEELYLYCKEGEIEGPTPVVGYNSFVGVAPCMIACCVPVRLSVLCIGSIPAPLWVGGVGWEWGVCTIPKIISWLR